MDLQILQCAMMLLRRQVPSGIELPVMMSFMERTHANT
jgi:hypothetical protein